MPLITKTCPQCRKEFFGEAFAMRKRIYCCHACYVDSRTQDLSFNRFGRLVAIERINGKRWRCRCDCGSESISTTQNLTSGKTKSCGCLNREISAMRRTKHGAHGTRAYTAWDGIVQRCTNPNFKQWNDYGGRGITVCNEWRNFANFLSDMGQPPDGCSIERIDNNLGYSKENCKWATRKEQQRNRRANKNIQYNGETLCITEWAERFGIAQHTAISRLNNGWSFDEAMGIVPRVTPVRDRHIRSDARWVEYNGRRLFFAEWCRELGINPKTAQSRLARGATNLQALGLAPM